MGQGSEVSKHLSHWLWTGKRRKSERDLTAFERRRIRRRAAPTVTCVDVLRSGYGRVHGRGAELTWQTKSLSPPCPAHRSRKRWNSTSRLALRSPTNRRVPIIMA